jgi:hypothetical protein
MYRSELELLGWTDEMLATETAKVFGKEVALDGGDDAGTRRLRALWFGQVTQHTMGPKTYEVRGHVGPTERKGGGEEADGWALGAPRVDREERDMRTPEEKEVAEAAALYARRMNEEYLGDDAVEDVVLTPAAALLDDGDDGDG